MAVTDDAAGNNMNNACCSDNNNRVNNTNNESYTGNNTNNHIANVTNNVNMEPNNVNEPTSTCKNPADTLLNGVCTRENYTCDLAYPCDIGYACGNNDLCECVDQDVCGLLCQHNDNCPDSMQCDTGSGVCKDRLHCTTDEMCPEGVCTQQELNSFVCSITTEGYDEGAGCTTGLNNNCASGICHEGACVDQCRSNNDCAQDERCGQVLLTMGCITQTACAGCNGPDQFCYNGICHDNACTEGSECVEGDCHLSLSNPLVGSCGTNMNGSMDSSRNCADHEFREGAYTSGILCMIHQACWDDDECDQGYECWTGDELLISTLGSTGFCGRLL